MQSHRPEELEHRFGSKADFMRYMSDSREFFFPPSFLKLNPFSTILCAT